MRVIPVLVAGALLALAGCGETDPRGSRREVVVYTSVDEVFAAPVARTFQARTGIEVRLVPDTEETKSTGLVNRLIAEKVRPQADVFWSGDPVRAAVLKREGVSEPYRPSAARGLPPEYSDPDGHWTGFSARARVIVYNSSVVGPEEAPRTLSDLNAPRFRGRACLANPLFGTTSMHAAALFAALGDDGAKAFFEGFLSNGGRMLSSNGEVRRRVATGEYALGLTDTDDFNVARLEGKPVSVVFPDADGMGTLVVPNCAVLVARGPHPEEGRAFIEYLVAPETEGALALSNAAQMPLRPGSPGPAGLPPLEALRPMKVDYAALGEALPRISRGFLRDWVSRATK